MKTLERVTVVEGDITPDFDIAARDTRVVAWDIETSGLDWRNDTLATCQVHVDGVGTQVVRVAGSAPERLRELLRSDRVLKLFHHAPFDLRFMRFHWNVQPRNIGCTKITSKILRPTATADEHSLKSLLSYYLGVEIDKTQRMSDWLADQLTDDQLAYAATDVQYLIPLFAELLDRARALGVADIVDRTLQYIPTRVETDILGCGDVFTY